MVGSTDNFHQLECWLPSFTNFGAEAPPITHFHTPYL